MTPREQAEADIRRIIDTETSAVRLSNALFTPGGLFSKLYSTPAEKRAVVDSPLFDEANDRLSELQRSEVGRLKRPEKAVVLPVAGSLQVSQMIPTDAAS